MKKTLTILTIGLLASLSASAVAQTSAGSAAMDSPMPTKQSTDGDGPPMIGPGSGAFKEFSNPQGWDKSAKAWHKQNTAAATDGGSVPPATGLDVSSSK